MLRVHQILLFLSLITNSLESKDKNYSILFLGHGFGSHSVIDNSLDPAFLNYFSKNQKKFNKVVLGGDFIYDCDSTLEVENFLEFYDNNNVNFVIGNHENCDNLFKLNEVSSKNHHELINESLIFYLNTSTEDESKIDKTFSYIESTISKELPKNVIIFTHQLIFSDSDWFVRVNSRKFYEYGNTLYQQIYEKYYGKTLPFFFVAGDLGAYDFTPHTFYHNDSNFTMLASGIGNSYNSKAIKIKLNKKVEYSIINLLSGNEENVNKYSKFKVQLYQFPKLVLSIIKRNYLLSISVLIIFILVYLTKIKSYKK